MITANEDVRKQMKEAGISYWQLADNLHCHESTVIRRFRHELPADEKARIAAVIQEIKNQ